MASALVRTHGEALAQYEKAMRLNPNPPQLYYVNLGITYTMLGRYEESVAQMKKALALSPTRVSDYSALIITYGAMAKQEEARQEGRGTDLPFPLPALPMVIDL